WTKFAPLLVAPLWASYPDSLARPREKAVLVGALLAATAAAFSILLLEPSPLHAAHVFYDRTIKFQIPRDSPFSIWDWKQYGAGMLDGKVPYLDFRVEYPPAALPVFVLPAIGDGHDQGTYKRNFERLMVLCGLLAIAGLALALSALRAEPERLLAALGFAAL